MPAYEANIVSDIHKRKGLGEAVLSTSLEHASCAEFVDDVAANTYDPARHARKNDLDVGTCVLQNEQKRTLSLNLILTLMLRRRSEHNMPNHTVALSLLAFRIGINRIFWCILSNSGVLLNVAKTEEMVQTMTSVRLKCLYFYLLNKSVH